MADVVDANRYGLGFDPDQLREKYRFERDRRVRSEGIGQYKQMVGQLASYLEDANAEPDLARAPRTDELGVVVIGGGFCGLLAAARLRESGISRLSVIEDGADFGGTWYWNQYPGAQCDVESYCYLPLLEELGFMPKEKYSYAPEIFEHCQRIAKHYGLYDGALFQTRVTAMQWEEDEARWTIRTNRGDALKSRFVVMATGPLSRPKLPAIPGIETFEGHSFHTSRWDYGYTGGNHGGGLTKLADKRVAVIGTGATAVQCVPFVAEYAKQLYVFQRTPSSIDRRGNKPTDPDWVASLEPGWQSVRRENLNNILVGVPVEEDLVNDGWTEIFSLAAGLPIGLESNGTAPNAAELAELADFVKMNQIRERIASIVRDPDTAEALKPWFRQFCKRPCFNDAYLPTFNRPNVELVDTSDTQGIEQIGPNGITTGGKDYQLDCLIFATGFEIGTPIVQRQGFDVVGKDRIKLSEHFAKGMKTLHGFTTHNFPNLFIAGASQNGLSFNYTSVIDDQAKHIAYIITAVRQNDHRYVEAKPEAVDAWVAELRSLAQAAGSEFFESCTPGYYNAEGHLKERPGTAGYGIETYVPGANAFNRLIADWRATGDFEGLEFH